MRGARIKTQPSCERDTYTNIDAVNKCAGAYTAGQGTGKALQTGLGGAASWKATGRGVKGASKGLEGATEFSPSIPARWVPGGRNGALDKFLTKTKLNGNYVSPKAHYLHDKFNFPKFMTADEALAEWGKKFGPARKALNRMPLFPTGAAGGAAVGDLSRRAQTGGCD